ncbi:MAG: hypothetical protein MPN21_26465 [Thermoanaerobaculia bacterium]|nr:hypothetical protein [Thermoanaerobaculia bacterium]
MFVVRLSIWIALVAWLAGPVSALVGRDHAPWQRTARFFWTLGCAVYLVHVAAAFHVVHGWSHTAALAATASETATVTGVESGMGLWLNYVFTLLWVADAAWWWRLGVQAYRRRPRWIGGMLYGFMIFMAFHATVVFEGGWVRVSGVAGSALLLALLLVAARRISRQGAS